MRALEIADTSAYSPVRLSAMMNLAAAHRQAGELHVAGPMITACVEEARKSGSICHLGNGLNSLGIVHTQKGAFNLAIDCFEEALSMASDLEDSRFHSQVLSNLAGALLNAGKTDDAIQRSQEGLEYAQIAGFPKGIAAALGQLGRAYLQGGQFDKATEAITESLRLYRLLGDGHGAVATLSTLGSVRGRLGNIKGAIECFKDAVEQARRQSTLKEEGDGILNLGLAYRKIGSRLNSSRCLAEAYVIFGRRRDYETWLRFELRAAVQFFNGLDGAVEELETELMHAQQSKEDRSILRLSHLLGNAHEINDQLADATARYQEALGAAERLKDQYAISVQLRNLGNCKGQSGRFEEAIALHKRALSLAQSLGEGAEIAKNQINLAYTLVMTGGFEEACELYEKAQEWASAQGHVEMQVRALGDLGCCLLNLGEHHRALKATKECLRRARWLPPESASLSNMYRENIKLAEQLIADELQ